jgi:Mn2+/Fe2+ NRAMP family transporter
MPDDRKKRPLEVVMQDFRRLSVGAWVAIVVLIALLVVAIAGVYYSGTDDLAAGVSGAGYLAMTLGVLFTAAIGVGLMGLIFYSSRRGYDQPPPNDPTDRDRQP